ncbi:hypothetical protein [Escherichia coli]|uniref:hypothetical protein n=1 Tax=Escherichia coli TaxID=562 RepID=UPI002543B4ED|nr:hypothetical protein [Escherichia coli]
MFQKIKIRKMTISRALDKYLKTVSIHKKGHSSSSNNQKRCSTRCSAIQESP